MPTYLNPESNPGDDYGLSSGVAAGDYVFTAGLAVDLPTLQRSAEAQTVADEVRLCLRQIDETLQLAGSGLRDVVKTTCWLADESYRGEFLEAYKEVFAPGPYPERATMVAGIAGGCRVQIEAVAMKPPGNA